MLYRNKVIICTACFLTACWLLCSCESSGGKHLRKNMSIGQASVRGTAKNGTKTGAFVVTRMDQHVFVEGLQNWPAHLLGKDVVVSGILKWDAGAQRFAVERAHWELAPEE